ncbi:MAG: DUF167 domain-containing protein [Patescibacteria group bacterium]
MLITAFVKPRSRRNKIEWIDKDTVKIHTTEIPEKGKANKAIIKLLAKDMKKPISSFSIIRGATLPIKHIKVT